MCLSAYGLAWNVRGLNGQGGLRRTVLMAAAHLPRLAARSVRALLMVGLAALALLPLRAVPARAHVWSVVGCAPSVSTRGNKTRAPRRFRVQVVAGSARRSADSAIRSPCDVGHGGGRQLDEVGGGQFHVQAAATAGDEDGVEQFRGLIEHRG